MAVTTVGFTLECLTSGFEVCLAKLGKFNKLADGLEDVLDGGGKKIVNDAKGFCPVDTGDLYNSIESDTFTEKSGKANGGSGSITTTVSVGMYYGPYVEYGTGAAGSISGNIHKPEGLNISHDEGYARGHPAQPFFWPAVNQNLPIIEREIHTAVTFMLAGLV
ncbi:hypothetical protein AGMMS49992_33850 [Clostridia bacterium]|nr:hypothetical protein AGMMS49992_33850 [Clostridia bacterium]